LQKGEIFFALVGERFDGNTFCHEALKRGASIVTSISEFNSTHHGTVIYVKDTLKALQDTANYVRKKKDIPVMAITGSNGKTTTKEMAYSIFRKKHNILKNEGNLNNHIGVPLTLLKLQPEHEYAVLEFGMNSKGEIRRLAEIALPDCGMIINIGTAHIGELGNREAIRDAKVELLEKIPLAVLNKDDTFLMDGVSQFKGKVLTFSTQSKAVVNAHSIQTSDKGVNFKLSIQDDEEISIHLSVHGIFNVYNALAASALCHVFGIKARDIKDGLESYTGYPMRFEIIKKGGVTIINDAYNANPGSVEEALKELLHLRTHGRLIAVLGDMFELGTYAQQAHLSVVQHVQNMGIDLLIAVGEMMSEAARSLTSIEVKCFSDASKAGENLKELIKEGDIILFKGSRGMKMEKALNEVIHAL
jgi:UDP-N-acetylmuramoyl-tripeptide--D-alanyl-D-alanine ligase